MSKSKRTEAFTSIRVISEKAHKLLEKARKQREKKPRKTPRATDEQSKLEDLVVDISTGSVVRAAFAVLAIAAGSWLVYTLRDTILLLFLAMFVATVIDPGVERMEQMRIPRGIGILLHYCVALCIVLFLIVQFIPIVAEQIQGMAVILSKTFDSFIANPKISLPLINDELNLRLTALVQSTLQELSITELTDALAQFGQNLSVAAEGGIRFATRVAGGVVNFILSLIIVLVLAFFMQMEKEQIFDWFRGFFPSDYRIYLDNKSEAVHTKIGQWARGELLLMFSIFTLTLIALIILRMPYALTLAALAGIMEFIPAVGPIIAAVPAVLIAFTQEGFLMGFVVMGVYYVIQWCENNLLVPLIMKRAVGLSSNAILLAMLVGVSFPDTLHPVLGIMLAVPTTTILSIFLEDWRSSRR